jgi:salicylate hydroxylase
MGAGFRRRDGVKVAVGGGGIGGLAASLLLSRAGLEVTLIEKRPRLEEEGAGLQLSPNASRILIEAGLGPALLRNATAPACVRMRRAGDGREIATVPLGDHAGQRYGAPYLVIHRADLAGALDEAVRREERVTLELGCEALSASSNGEGVTLALARAGGVEERLDASALVVADGVWGRLNASGPPRFSGFTAWRGLAPAGAVPAFARDQEVGLWLGPRAHLVHYPIRGGDKINIVAVVEDRDPQEGWSRPAEPERLAASFAGFSGTARVLISCVPQWRIWSLFDREPLRRWGEGPITLLGDAAHPMLPFLAQGAAMAIEDAATLAAELAPIAASRPSASRSDIADAITMAFGRYEEARMARTARVQREARRNALAYHAVWPISAARNLILSASSNESLLARYDWLYGWRPTPPRSSQR